MTLNNNNKPYNVYTWRYLQNCPGNSSIQQKKANFTSKLDLNLWKKLIKYHNWNRALYGAGNWTLGKEDQI